MNQENYFENQQTIISAVVGILSISIIALMALLFNDEFVLFGWLLTPVIMTVVKEQKK